MKVRLDVFSFFMDMVQLQPGLTNYVRLATLTIKSSCLFLPSPTSFSTHLIYAKNVSYKVPFTPEDNFFPMNIIPAMYQIR